MFRSRHRVIAKIGREKGRSFATNPAGTLVRDLRTGPFEVVARARGLSVGRSRGIEARWAGAVRVEDPDKLAKLEATVLTLDGGTLTTRDIDVLASRWLQAELEAASEESNSVGELKREARTALTRFLERFPAAGLNVTRPDGLTWHEPATRRRGWLALAVGVVSVAALALGAGFAGANLGGFGNAGGAQPSAGPEKDSTAERSSGGASTAGTPSPVSTHMATATRTTESGAVVPSAASPSAPTAVAQTPMPPTSTPTPPTPSPVPKSTPPPNREISQGVSTELDAGWSWVCTGDLTFFVGGRGVEAFDNDPDTGLLTIVLRGASASAFNSGFGGSCGGSYEEAVQASADRAEAEMRSRGCTSGCEIVIRQTLP